MCSISAQVKGTSWEVTVVHKCRLLLVLSLAALANSMATVAEDGSPGLREATPEVVIGESSGAFPTGCSPEAVVDLVSDFLDAFNRGDRAALSLYFPSGVAPAETVEPGKFHWYTVGGRPSGINGHGFQANNRDELLRYFDERHGADERMRLLQIEMQASRDAGIAIQFNIARDAVDIPAHVAGGKGAVMCKERTIWVWSMSDEPVLPDVEGAAGATPEAA